MNAARNSITLTLKTGRAGASLLEAAETAKEAQEKLVEDLKQVKKDYKRLVQENRMKEALTGEKIEASKIPGKEILEQEQEQRRELIEAEQARREKENAERKREVIMRMIPRRRRKRWTARWRNILGSNSRCL
jgi:hypothetical protein